MLEIDNKLSKSDVTIRNITHNKNLFLFCNLLNIIYVYLYISILKKIYNND